MKFLIAIGFYGLQPVLWIGVIRAYLIHTNRLNRERKLFRSAIYDQFYEGRHFVRSGLILGVCLSIIFSWLLVVSAQWVILYEALVLVSLILVPGQFLGVTAAAIAAVVTMIMPHIPALSGIERWLNHLGISGQAVNPLNFLLITSLIILVTGIFIRFNAGRFDSPAIARNTRNNKVAVFPFNELTVIPFLMLMPGDWIKINMSFIPLFQIHGHAYVLVFLPILIGLKITVAKSAPRAFFKQLSREFIGVAVFGIGLLVVTVFVPQFTLAALVVLIGAYYGVLGLARRRDRHQNFEYSEVMDGIRVIGIQPGTPAAKMDLDVGDVILTVNGIQVTNEDQFYRAISTSPTYCRFKVRDRNDQLKMTESAIFKNSPHEIGVKTYAQSFE